MLILGIETSCDETGASLVENGKRVYSNVVFSQIEIHRLFNGVVPEIASRNHLEKIIPVINEAIKDFTFNDIDGIAITNGPGLIGALLVGISAAKGIAYPLKKPLIPINHIMGHIYSAHLTNEIEFPYIALVASGGHTLLYKFNSFYDYELLGSTIDDAIGEAYDKIAKILNLTYPGGPIIDKLANEGDENFLNLPYLFPDKDNDRYNFSYSGLKTAILYRIKNIELSEQNIKNICASFQKAAIELLLRKTINALNDFKIKNLVIAGGVAANSLLRKKLNELRNIYNIFIPELKYCSDNAAMIAGRAYIETLKGLSNFYDYNFDAFSRLHYIKKGKR